MLYGIDNRRQLFVSATLLPPCCTLTHHHERRPVGGMRLVRFALVDQHQQRAPLSLRPPTPWRSMRLKAYGARVGTPTKELAGQIETFETSCTASDYLLAQRAYNDVRYLLIDVRNLLNSMRGLAGRR